MKAEFYYKEEFPLELRITITNLNELTLIYAFFSKSAEHMVNTSTMFSPARKEELLKYISEEEKELQEAIHMKVYEEIKTLWKEHEGRNLLQREVSEGAKNSDTK